MEIKKRGNFFEDAFFDDVCEKFERAVGTVLEKCGESSSSGDVMTAYRKLRQQDLKEENQAGTISYGEKENTIVLDVHDFNLDDIKITVLENNTIQIKGHVGDGSDSTPHFDRQFTLPGTMDMTIVTPSLSADGILAISVPRARMMTIQKRGSFYDDSFFSEVRDKFERTVIAILERCGISFSAGEIMTAYRKLRQQDLKEENQAGTISYGAAENTIVLDVHGFNQDAIKVIVCENNTINITGYVEKEKEKIFFQQFIFPGTMDMTNVKASLSSDGILTITVPRIYVVEDEEPTTTKQEIGNISESSRNTEINQCTSTDSKATESVMKATKVVNSKSSAISSLESGESSLFSPRSLIINRRGHFLKDSFFGDSHFSKDSFFSDSRQHFDEAMKGIMQEFDTTDRVIDAEHRYSMAQNSRKHKIVMDVKQFTEGSINVKVVGGSKLVVEGENKQKKGSSISSQRFNRPFELPSDIDMSSVESSLSSDGFLTITSPKIMGTKSPFF